MEIAADAKLRLDFPATDTVAALTIGGVAMQGGKSYGSSASGADVQDDAHFAGAGRLHVTAAGGAYDVWALQIPDPAQRGRDQDPDGDGLTNLHEFLFGGDPNSPDGAPVALQAVEGIHFLSWLQSDSGEYKLEESAALEPGSWLESALTPVPAADQTGTPAGYVRWMAKIPVDGGRMFFRIRAREN